MPSTASHVGRTLHRHEREMDSLERDLAHEETSTRAELDRKHAGTKEAALAKASRLPPSGGRSPVHIPSHEAHIDHRVAQISKLRDQHNLRRKAMRDKHRKELEAARKKPAMAGNHVPQRKPEPHQGHAFVIWKDLNAARQEAMRTVFRSTAVLGDKADAEVLDLAKSTSANRYMQPGARMASDSADRHERAHLDISRKEQQQLDSLANRFEGEIDSERRRTHEQAVARADLEQRQMDENRRAMR
jgi:hypothetical protein